MNRFFSALSACILYLSLLPSAQASFTLWSDNYESGSVSDMRTTSGLSLAVVNDPVGGGSKVLQVNDTSTTTEWIELRPSWNNSGILNVGAGTPIGYGSLVTMSFDIYFPSPGTAETFTTVVRLKNSQNTTPYKDFTLATTINPTNTAIQNQWLRNQTISFLLPESFVSGGTTYSVDTLAPILSFRDTTARPEGSGAGGSTGTMVYLDNLHVGITPEPKQVLLSILGAGALLGLRRRS